MWKVVVTEIQDASALEPFDVPSGAYFVSRERLARTVENLDLPWLIDALEAMQSTQKNAREARPMSSQGTPPNLSWLRANRGAEMHRLNRERSQSTAVANQLVAKNGP